jgi:uncharacterized SAM-binding protein YcdF (DUF218 family)
LFFRNRKYDAGRLENACFPNYNDIDRIEWRYGGGNASGYQSGAEAKADILKLMDIPEEKMVLETRSRKILLSTSASHIRRAKAIFTGIGISVLPAATDYQLVERALDRSLAGDNQKD